MCCRGAKALEQGKCNCSLIQYAICTQSHTRCCTHPHTTVQQDSSRSVQVCALTASALPSLCPWVSLLLLSRADLTRVSCHSHRPQVSMNQTHHAHPKINKQTNTRCNPHPEPAKGNTAHVHTPQFSRAAAALCRRALSASASTCVCIASLCS
jgi:hypothetical protein